MIDVRKTREEDLQEIRDLVKAAFQEEDEARIVHKLESTKVVAFSFVAVQDEQVVGYILYTPVTLDSSPDRFFLGLAPIAVKPSCQKRGIGSHLIHESLAFAKSIDAEAVFVLGDPAYYHRFGFQTSEDFNIASEFKVDAQFFMVLELQPESLRGLQGVIRYLPDFNAF